MSDLPTDTQMPMSHNGCYAGSATMFKTQPRRSCSAKSQNSELHQPQQAVSLKNSSVSWPRLKKIRRKLLHVTHAKIQIVRHTQRTRKARPRAPKCAARNRELGPV